MPQTDSFYCDTMLGRLAKRLRLLGHDTAYRNYIDDWDLLTTCRNEDRVLLTRDSQIVKRWQVGRGWVKVVLLKSDNVDDQLQELAALLSLAPAGGARCSLCNQALAELPRDEARSKVPAYVFETQDEFHACPECGRIYWKATHWSGIEKMRSALAPPTGKAG